MCYPSNENFRRSFKKGSAREPEGRRETNTEERPELRVEAQDFKFWAFPRWRRERKDREPVADLTREKV
ncbi:hypothetical protein V3C33_12665 [Micrococcaceae bacterium Sec5.7]